MSDPNGEIAWWVILIIVAAAAVITTAVSTYVGAKNEKTIVYDVSLSFSSGAGVGYKIGISMVVDFENKNIEFYGHEVYAYGVKANAIGFSYSTGIILNYEKAGDYGGPSKNTGFGYYIGLDHCYDPRVEHSETVQAYSFTFGNNKEGYLGEDEYYYWGNISFNGN